MSKVAIEVVKNVGKMAGYGIMTAVTVAGLKDIPKYADKTMYYGTKVLNTFTKVVKYTSSWLNKSFLKCISYSLIKLSKL